MKQGRRLTRRQKVLVQSRRLNPSDWLRTKAPPGELHLVHRHVSNLHRLITLKGDEHASLF